MTGWDVFWIVYITSGVGCFVVSMVLLAQTILYFRRSDREARAAQEAAARDVPEPYPKKTSASA